MSNATPAPPTFSELGLSTPVLQALTDVGYETPSPIQAQTIPPMLAGRDIVGQAQTGTGKTAAFALPLLSRINLSLVRPQVLVLTPTRELAIQVAEAFQRYAAHIKGFHVMPVYGGQEYGIQLRQLKRGTHVVIGTPGRVMDHMRRGSLKLDSLISLVLDEADEMLRRGFIDDVEWVLEQSPSQHQIALFSATMPEPIRRIAKKHLKNPEQIIIKSRTTTVETTRQRYLLIENSRKLEALTRILEATTFNGMLIFVRTRNETTGLSEKLEARGYASAALSGDITQKVREQTVNRLKSGKLDILVATDVAARGLDVERISHVINYDVPNDPEAYVHRIGRTGRFGRSGEAIIFVTPRERHMLQAIERSTRHKIEAMNLPTADSINDERITRFKQKISDTLAQEDLSLFHSMLEQYQREQNVAPLDIAAALAKLLQGNTPLLMDKNVARDQSVSKRERFEKKSRPERHAGMKHKPHTDNFRSRPDRKAQSEKHTTDSFSTRSGNSAPPERAHAEKKLPPRAAQDMSRYKLDVGSSHGVKAGDIVGAIANEAGLESCYIQNIAIHEDHSTVDLPEGMPREIFRTLQKAWLGGRQLNISLLGQHAGPGDHARKSKDKPHHKHKHKK